MRGKGVVHVFVPEKLGITPAHAGKRIRSRLPDPVGGDHPRMCGEKQALLCTWMFLQGSPPHVRGKVSSKQPDAHIPGITPACAGKRRRYPSCCWCRGHPPRMCGEKCVCGCLRTLLLGSPPHVRGKARGTSFLDVLCGITPACAGKRVRGIPRTYNERDHPRMCGEKFVIRHGSVKLPGSPPHVRGKEAAPIEEAINARITPACAGKSSAPLHSVPQRGDHPRMCGEKLHWDFTRNLG